MCYSPGLILDGDHLDPPAGMVGGGVAGSRRWSIVTSGCCCAVVFGFSFPDLHEESVFLARVAFLAAAEQQEDHSAARWLVRQSETRQRGSLGCSRKTKGLLAPGVQSRPLLLPLSWTGNKARWN